MATKKRVTGINALQIYTDNDKIKAICPSTRKEISFYFCYKTNLLCQSFSTLMIHQLLVSKVVEYFFQHNVDSVMYICNGQTQK